MLSNKYQVSLFQRLPQVFKSSLRGHSLLQFVHQSFSLGETTNTQLTVLLQKTRDNQPIYISKPSQLLLRKDDHHEKSHLLWPKIELMVQIDC